MILLGMDTCGSVGTLALARVVEGRVAWLGSAELAGRSTAARLTPSLEQMLGDAGVRLGEVAGVVVVDGPGSFTGIRIGLSTVKGLAEGGSLGVYAISRLRVLAVANGGGFAALDAGRGEFYYGAYARGQDQGEWLVTAEELGGLVAGRGGDWQDLVVCEAKVATAFAGAQLAAAPSASDAIEAGLADVLAGRATEVAGLDGRYLRRSDLYRLAQPLTR